MIIDIILTTLFYVVCAVGALMLFWIIFVGVMAVKNSWDRLPLPAKILGSVWGVIGMAMDIALNWSLFILIFMDWPRERTVTAHCSRLKREGNAYQRAVANWTCRNLLDPFENGGHCHD